jgi:hypothetical protein
MTAIEWRTSDDRAAGMKRLCQGVNTGELRRNEREGR